MNTDQKIKNLRAALADLGQDTRQWTDHDLLKAVFRGPSRLPEWADQSPDGVLSRLRAEADPGFSDTELLLWELNRMAAESRRHENAYTMLLQDRVKHDRAVRTAAHRSAIADITAQAGLYLRAIVQRNAQPIEGVIYRAENLPEDGRAPVAQVRELREAALKVRWLMRGLVTDKSLEDARKDEGIQALEKLKAELRRVQVMVSSVGQALHRTYGRTTGETCTCSGCELIRSVHDVPEADHAASA